MGAFTVGGTTSTWCTTTSLIQLRLLLVLQEQTSQHTGREYIRSRLFSVVILINLHRMPESGLQRCFAGTVRPPQQMTANMCLLAGPTLFSSSKRHRNRLWHPFG